MILRRAVGDGVADRLVLRHVVRVDMAGMQEAEMRGVDLALERLQVVAVALDEADAISSSGTSRISNAGSGGASAREPM